jgi:arylsulfatase
MDQGRLFVEQHASDETPWFLWVGPPGPHDPFDPPGEWAHRYDPKMIDPGLRRFSTNPLARMRAEQMQVKEASDRQIQEMRSLYYGGISFIDHKIGQQIQDLKDRGEYDNTWIIFTADHGEFAGDFHLTTKGQFHWQADRIPLVIKPPAKFSNIPRGTHADALVEFIDIATTICDIAGGAGPGDCGMSLLPILKGEVPLAHHRQVAHSQVGDTFMIQTSRYKLIFQDKDRIEVQALFDLEHDPGELNNIVADEPEMVNQLITEVVKPFFESTSDRLEDPWRDTSPWQQWGRSPHLEAMEP